MFCSIITNLTVMLIKRGSLNLLKELLIVKKAFLKSLAGLLSGKYLSVTHG